MNVFLHLKTSTGGSTGVIHEAGLPFFTAKALAAMSTAAEQAGFHGIHVTDHPFPSDEALSDGIGHQTLDPMVALSIAAAATTRLRLLTHLYILPYRNPFLTARAVSTLDVISDGRLILGVGAGYMEGEFSALGVKFEERNELTDEAMHVMRVAWSGESVKLRGIRFDAPGNTMLPRPVQRPSPPMWVGGNSKRAARRAGELGDGFVPFLNSAQLAPGRHTPPIESLGDLKQIVNYAQDIARKNKRPVLEIGASPLGMERFGTSTFNIDESMEYVRQLKTIGVTTLTMGLNTSTVTAQVDLIRRFGDEVMPDLAST